MTVLSGNYKEHEPNVVIVLESGTGEHNRVFKDIWPKIIKEDLRYKYNVFLAKDFIRIKHLRTETVNDFKVRHNIYSKKTDHGYTLCVSEGRFLNTHNDLEAFDMSYPTKHSGTEEVKTQEIEIDLLIVVREVPISYLLATRQNGIDAQDLLQSPGKFEPITGKCKTRIVSYEALGKSVGKDDKVFPVIQDLLKIEPAEVKESLDMLSLVKKIRKEQPEIKEGLEKMGMEV